MNLNNYSLIETDFLDNKIKGIKSMIDLYSSDSASQNIVSQYSLILSYLIEIKQKCESPIKIIEESLNQLIDSLENETPKNS